jgi:hypothetical protein
MNKIEAFNQSLFLWTNAGVGTPSWAVDTAIVLADDLIESPRVSWRLVI